MKKIYIYTPSANGGHALFTNELTSALSDVVEDFSIELVTSTDLAPTFRNVKYKIHDILPVMVSRDAFKSKLIWGISRICHYVKREILFLSWVKQKTDVAGIHFQEFTFWLAPLLFRIFKKRRIALFYTIHNVRPHKYPSFMPRRLYDALHRESWLLCDGLFVLSESLKDQLADMLGPGHPPIFVSPHGVWSVAEPESITTVERKQKQILFFGAIRENKGLHILLQAMKGLEGYSLVIAGYPSHINYYNTKVLPLVHELVSKNISIELIPRFIAESEIPALFAASTMLVLPYTEFDAQSGVLYLAIAHDLPIVATNKGAMGEVVRSNALGQVVDNLDCLTLAGAIKGLHSDIDTGGMHLRFASAKDTLSWKASAVVVKHAYSSIVN